MQIIKLRFKSAEQFVQHLSPEGAGRIFCPTTTPHEEGTSVIMDINFPILPNRTMVRGEVVWWRPALPRMRIRAGALVAVHPDETEKIHFLLDVSAGNADKYKRRRYARLPVYVPVRWRPTKSTEYRQGDLNEISMGGALLKSGETLPIGTEVIMELVVPGTTAPTSIAGRVTYAKDGSGNGIRFLYREGGGSRRIREVIRRIQAEA
jgi:Tfp pilus assembly protein PilZ